MNFWYLVASSTNAGSSWYERPWSATRADPGESSFDLGSMAHAMPCRHAPAMFVRGHQRGYHVQRAESSCSHPGGTFNESIQSIRFFPHVDPGFVPQCSAAWQWPDSGGHWHRISILLSDVEWLTVGLIVFLHLYTLCFSWYGGWPQWIVNCDSLIVIIFKPSSCMARDSWQARVRKAKELEAHFGFGMTVSDLSQYVTHMNTHTQWNYVYIYNYVFTYVI